MTKPIYIHGHGCISIQPTFETNYFFETVHTYAQNPIPVLDPDYKARIPPLQLRRMNKSMKMAISASKLALEEAGNVDIDAVITGTGQGCLRDSERFVETILADEAELLNPTPFIQSTHNMAAAAIALALGCKGYNMTYVNNANSFESALLDGMLYLQEHPSKTILLGGVDELGSRSPEFWNIAGYLKHGNSIIPSPMNVDSGPGEISAEGAAFFVASHQEGKQAYGKIIAVETRHKTEDAAAFINQFLQRNGLDIEAIDAVLMGNNGDVRYDGIYETVCRTLFQGIPQVGFKQVLGEYDTVVAAALMLALHMLKRQQIPKLLHMNGPQHHGLQRILLYTQRRGKNHSLILVER
ncbi:beta-ketoacyl synthase chain length factor [Parapedobacter tibetensis]|uniref:beta-ketoacyl synthase chain length factor n=1 Tax=Parapedobacter tibetensis TaxID=2972951 RepID=UPI00214D82F0|nr:beta-ketoacyl synthase chain length factor [Parapedobacter tibetensis]